MERFRLPSIFMLFVSFVGGVAVVSTGKRALAAPADNVQARPLKDPIRLDTGGLRSTGGRKLLPQVSFVKVDQKFTEFAGNAKSYESGAKAMPEIAKQCAAKSYSVQDQKAAGCGGNDTLNQCMDKLYRHCIENFSTPDVSLGLPPPITGGGAPGKISGFSTKQFQQSAKTTAAEARALSQLLSLYANEVDQNAKALVP